MEESRHLDDNESSIHHKFHYGVAIIIHVHLLSKYLRMVQYVKRWKQQRGYPYTQFVKRLSLRNFGPIECFFSTGHCMEGMGRVSNTHRDRREQENAAMSERPSTGMQGRSADILTSQWIRFEGALSLATGQIRALSSTSTIDFYVLFTHSTIGEFPSFLKFCVNPVRYFILLISEDTRFFLRRLVLQLFSYWQLTEIKINSCPSFLTEFLYILLKSIPVLWNFCGRKCYPQKFLLSDL